MVDFEYYNPAKIVFGENSVDKIGDLLKEYKVSSLLLVYSGEFIKSLGIYGKVKDAAAALGIDFYENGNVVPNPSIELVRELVVLGKEKNVDFVLAVGGGSAIDTAKATALGIPYEGDVWDFFEKGVSPETVLPLGVISTLPASGSETSNAAILSNGVWKLGFEDNRIIPKFAIMNPAYTVGLPNFQTFAGVADILSHLLERYFSDVKHTDVTDYLIEGAVQALLVNGKRLKANPKDLNARAEIQWLATVAHNNILDTGRIGDWGSHRIEHELSGQYGITHGEGMAVVLPAWVRYVANVKPWKLSQLAVRVFHEDAYNHTEAENALALADHLEHFFRELGLRTRLSELGIDDKYFADMAKRATRNGTVGHYLPLDEHIFVEILKIAQ
ncbi:MAG: iron-containing alcohol dehydrogenase [Paludibacteraceae bacterium]|nr:iron-containing alcohol dehydrogenase [Paludibacteraceae bacterium]